MITDKELRKEISRILASGKRGEIPIENGLILDVMTSGRTFWRFRFRENGQSHRKSIGGYPLVSLKDARAKRDELRLLILRGESISKPKKKVLTLQEVFDEWMQNQVEPQFTEKYIYNTRVRIQPLLKECGKMQIDEVKSSDILAVIRKVEAKGHYETAHRLRQIAGQVFRYAIATDNAQVDPTYALRGALHSRSTKHYPRITDPQKVGQLMRDIRDKGQSPVMRALLMLHAYTFVRPKEIREAEWAEFDLDRAVWCIPAEKMKMRRLHVVPLARQVVELLRVLFMSTGHGRFLFPAQTSMDGSRHISDNAENKALRDRGYLREEMVGHGFRGMASTLLHNNGFSSQVIEIQLSHIDSNSVRESYNDADYMEKRVEMMQWYADYLDALRDGK
ncbi:MAG: tyrosine-type recombinase/integrase [Synergistaceae bacterium]|nr:tyrosine-type recombinase/integrase [Synergistaceae bacterium]